MRSFREYLATHRLPHVWCPGCGHGVILKAILLALAELDVPREKALLATGIGCAGRAGDYVACHRFQGTHGRTPAFVTGIKLARPELTVVCLLGDGDCAAIGLHHVLHAARRNVGVTTVVANNFNYGMTGGQYSPLTPAGSITSTSRSGHAEATADLCRLVAAAGAVYVARTTVYHVGELRRFVRTALGRKGFALIEVLTPCPTYYGRYNRLGGAADMLTWLIRATVPLREYEKMPGPARQSVFWRGVLVDRESTGEEEAHGK